MNGDIAKTFLISTPIDDGDLLTGDEATVAWCVDLGKVTPDIPGSSRLTREHTIPFVVAPILDDTDGFGQRADRLWRDASRFAGEVVWSFW